MVWCTRLAVNYDRGKHRKSLTYEKTYYYYSRGELAKGDQKSSRVLVALCSWYGSGAVASVSFFFRRGAVSDEARFPRSAV